MRKMYVLLLLPVLSLMLLLGGCGGDDGNSNTNEQTDSIPEVEVSEASNEAIEVDKNLFNVEITIPSSFLTDADPEQVKAKAEQEEGIKEAIINADGSITYKMTKAAHVKMLNDLQQEIENSMQEIKNNEDFPSIMDIKANKSYSECTMIVDRQKYENSFDGIAALSLGIASMFYQVFDGTDAETLKAIIHVEDFNTGEIFNTIIYPDALS